MAGEKARITEEIISRIAAHEHEDTEVYIDNFKQSLSRQLVEYDEYQAEMLQKKLERKEGDSKQDHKHYSSEQKWKVRTALREVKTEQINVLRDKTRKRLTTMLNTPEYVGYLELAKSKAPKSGTYYVRAEDVVHFKDVDTKVATIPLGGFKVVDGSRIIDFTLETAFKEVFDSFSNTLNIDGQE
ncbi:hypothetical protein AOC36_11565 [Erysipelothrix larvae]|uniref:ATPase n=1 Tax=Erysipelothrix larvae TaxID=1514105 RepID=A0A0X8H1V8_9FIRM|nr:hypothetical protein [Erysipelothrix larvae]AMC94587.1 hypothetical protein AOC36_11565 [Erysipelothrix larvae]